MKTQETAATGEGNAPRKEQDPYCDFCKDAIADEIQKDYEHVKAQRDELLAAAKQAEDTLNFGASWSDKDFVIDAFGDARKRLQAAIRNAKRGAQ